MNTCMERNNNTENENDNYYVDAVYNDGILTFIYDLEIIKRLEYRKILEELK